MRAGATVAAFALLLAAPAWAKDKPAPAPDPEEAAVVATVKSFFEGMRKPDAEAVRAMVLPGSTFTAVRRAPDGAGTQVRRISLDDFVKSLRPGVDEQAWAPRISLRGGMLATLSAPYEVKVDGKTLHCGIDVFDLVKSDGQWKISNVAWTAEPDACPELTARR